MEKLEDMRTKENLIREFFVWLFDDSRISDKSVSLESEVDLSLVRDYLDPNIYYPKQIAKFFQTKPMQRLGRISQIALVNNPYPNTYHNRLEHSKGVYNRKLEEFLYNYQNPEWRKKLENNNNKLYLLAELIKMAGHDIGHFPLSHLMEIEILSRRGAHETLGKRIMLENEEIQSFLSEISPDLPNILKCLYENHIMNFDEHDESSYDVDRLDYIVRDNLYFGTPVYFSTNKYETVPVELDDDGRVKTNDDYSIQISPTSKSCIDVYDFESLESIEKLLKLRLNGYKTMYSQPYITIKERTIGAFFSVFLSKPSNSGKNLRDFITSFKSKDTENIDLDKYLEWDDIKLYSEILDIAENHDDKNVRNLAIMTIPNLESFLTMIYSHMQIRQLTKNGYTYSHEDRVFLKKIKHIITSNDETSINLRNPNFSDENTLFFPNHSSSLSAYSDLIFSSTSHIKSYSSKEPIYIRNEDGKIYELSHHPQRKCNWDRLSSHIDKCYSYIPYLKLNGVPDSTIDKLKSISVSPSYYLDKSNTNYGKIVNMQPLQVGNSLENCFLNVPTEDER